MDTYSYLFRSSTDYRRNIRRKATFQKRCLTMAKQERTRFYILRRCVSMLLCWNNHSIQVYPSLRLDDAYSEKLLNIIVDFVKSVNFAVR
ncbi:hypothetical protein L6452_26568 [Arctium lappa]|uniref:Uncharacterized protein n=1 Tax=Arctium lappa TaxID=4217 RepID=A0ACB8ZVC5_ARCLA|nr:hypothetical protein L6452_26568 [Arctium lappa]